MTHMKKTNKGIFCALTLIGGISLLGMGNAQAEGSIKDGTVKARACQVCHGKGGLGDGPVSMTGEIQGPLAAVLAVAGPASIARVRSDGHIYTTIRSGRRRMPGYTRILSSDRWDIVNYVRYLNGQKGVQ